MPVAFYPSQDAAEKAETKEVRVDWRCPPFDQGMSALKPLQLRAVTLLAQGKSHAETAKELGIASKTIQRWMKLEEFVAAVADVQHRVHEKTIEGSSDDIAGQIKSLIPVAIDVLQDILGDAESKPSDRLRAVSILGNWAGLTQSRQPEQPTAQPEQNLKQYLELLKNGNGNGHH